MRRLIPTPVPAILCSIILAGAAAAQPRSYTVYRAQTAPKIDGRLDDECWRAAPWQTGFLILGGGEAAETTQTQFAMVWDDANLYLAVRCRESAMDRLAAKADDGSKELFHDDHVEIFLAPEKQREDYAQFAVNSLNKRIDISYQARKETATQAVSKGGKWVSACRHGEASWELEMALPLAALKIEPHEGVSFVGDIGRVRCAEEPDRPVSFTWTPLKSGFDSDPAAFGLFKLAGAPPAVMRAYSLAVEQWRDTVSTLQGDRFTGAVLGIGADGWLHMNGPQFGGDVTLAASVVTRVEFSPPRDERSGPRVILNNGDYVLGQVQSITPDQTVIVNPEIGTLTAPTASLSEILVDTASADYVDTAFEWGTLEPWMPVQGHWTLSEGKATCSAGPQGEPVLGVLSVPLEQKGPVTFFADVELPQAGAWIDCELFVFSDQPDLQDMHNGISFHLKGNDSGCTAVTPEAGVQNLGSWGTGSTLVSKARIQFQVQYDPKEGMIQPWLSDTPALGDTPAGQYRFTPGPKSGRYVLFVTNVPLAVRHLRAEPGFVPPRKMPAPEPDSAQVMLLNGDTISAKAVTFAEGKFTVVTDFGNIEPELKRVQVVRFPHRAAAPSPSPEAEATVRTTEGCFTLHSCVLADDKFTGQSDSFGAVSLPRDAIRSIRFRRSAP
jgi:hypothetical protein